MNSDGAIMRPSALPPNERLQSADARRRQLDDRLIEDREVVAFDCAAKLGLEGERFSAAVHVGVEQLVAAASPAAFARYMAMSVAKQRIDGPGCDVPTTMPILAAPRICCPSPEGLGQRLLQPFCDAAHVLVGLDVLREHAELVAAKPREHVAGRR